MAGLVLALSALAPGSAAADGPAPNWEQLATTGPSARIAPYLDYDSSRGRTVLFGGAESVSQYDSDTWEFDGTAWTRVGTSGPPAGGLGAMAFDSARGVSVLFGGGNANSTLPAVTWAWNGSVWTSHVTAHAPASRIWHAMTYDSVRHVVVLFGGGASGGMQFNDTWEYDGSDWRQVVTTHAPSVRYGLGLAFDPTRNRTVLFGGWTSVGRSNDTWEYDGADWTQVTATNPPAPRWAHSMAYDPAIGRTVVFGGDYLISGRLGPNNETWAYDGAAWQLIAPANSPSPRDWAPMAYDTAHSSLVLFGGTDEGMPQHPLGDTWAFGTPGPTATVSASAVNFPQSPVLSVSSQAVTLTNTGGAPLLLSNIAAGGDFGETDDCPRSPAALTPSSTCSITVFFTPSTGNGVITGSLTLTDNAGTGVQSIPLSGSGQWGELNLFASQHDFGTAPINLSGPTATGVETFNIPDFPTLVSSITVNAPFAVTGIDCPVGLLLPVGATCHLQLSFQPTTPGTYSDRLVLHDNTPNFQSVITLTGTATPLPVSISVEATPTTPTFGSSIQVSAQTNATSGLATFTLNGHQVGAPQPISTSGVAIQVIPVDDSTVPAGAGTYPLAVSVHPTDGIRADNSSSQAITVVPAPAQLVWNGTGLAVAGATANLSATVTPFNVSGHPAWVRFDVTDGSGIVRTFYGQVVVQSGVGSASVKSGTLAAGAYSVRARLVAASGSDQPNAFLTSEELRTAFAAQPQRGGFLAGLDQEPGFQAIAFEFSTGSRPSGSVVWVSATQVVGEDGNWRDAYMVVVSTAVSSITSRKRTATVNGSASVMVVDATTGVRYSAFDQATTFQLNVNADGSASLWAGGSAADIPAGSVINHL